MQFSPEESKKACSPIENDGAVNLIVLILGLQAENDVCNFFFEQVFIEHEKMSVFSTTLIPLSVKQLRNWLPSMA